MALKDAMGRTDKSSQIYVVFTADGETYYWGAQGFAVASVTGKPPVYPVVKDWGPLRNFSPIDGEERDNDVAITVDAGAVSVPSTGTSRQTCQYVAQQRKLQDVVFVFYQWNAEDQTQFELWRGYCRGVTEYTYDGGEATIVITISSRGGVTESSYVGDVVVKDGTAIGSTTYPNAPTDSLGRMIGKAYGQLYHGLIDTAAAPNDAIFLGYGTRGIKGLVIDDQQADLKAKIRFIIENGTTVTSLAGTTDTPSAESTYWVYLPEGNTYGLIDAADFSVANDGAKLEILAKLEPTLFVALRPSDLGTQMAAGFNATAYKILDDDPSNYIESTTTDYKWAFNLPPLGISGFRVTSVGVVIDIVKSGAVGVRDVQYGLWNDQNAGGAGWWGNSVKLQQILGVSTVRSRQYTAAANRYTQFDARAAATTGTRGTMPEFAEGRFVSHDANNVEIPIQVFVQVSSASKDGVRIHGIGVYVKGKIQLDRIRRVSGVVKKKKNIYDYNGRKVGERDVYEAAISDVGVVNERRYDVLFAGTGLNDDGSGTYEGGGAGVPIRRISAAVHSMLDTILPGTEINTSSGTLGNFVDARAETVTGEKWLSPTISEDPFTIGQSIGEIQRRHPVRFFRDRGKWQCIYDEQNPHSSRFFRSTSDYVRISAKRHVARDRGAIRVSAIRFDELQNRVLLNYGHVYGTNRPVKSLSYEHPFSTARFGAREAIIYDEPWVTPVQVDVVPPSATYLARYLGSKFARPRLTVRIPLLDSLFDLSKGHVVEADYDWETAGIQCPAYRCGRVDYAYYRSDIVVADQSDSTTPTFVPGGMGSPNSSYWGSAGMQFDQLRLKGIVAGTYTNVANAWKYWDGSAWTALSNVRCSDGGSPDTVFKRTGDITVQWDRPNPWAWKKLELSFAGTSRGPCYWVAYDYSTTTTASTGTGMTDFPAVWAGRLFEIVEATLKPETADEGAYIDAVLQEVM